MSADENHVIPFKTYLWVLLFLLAMTVLTVGVATPVSGVDFGFLNTIIAMLIATVKATAVMAIFMHLKYDNKLFLVIFLTGVFFLIVMFAFSWIDIISRINVDSTL